MNFNNRKVDPNLHYVINLSFMKRIVINAWFGHLVIMVRLIGDLLTAGI